MIILKTPHKNDLGNHFDLSGANLKTIFRKNLIL